MSSFVGAGPLQATLPVATDLASLGLAVLSAGLVGMSIRNMFESIMSEEDGPDAGDGDDASADGGGLMTETSEDGDGEAEGDDDLGGLGGGLDDGGDEDLGGFEDEGGFGDMDDEGGGSVDELEHRLDELEAEVGSLSSTVNTVRNENEQISESVGEVEENVRKLLDIYEMVTRGVNPFADDVDPGMGGMGDGGGFGLFDDGGGGTEEALDQDIAEADAEGFFDEDLVGDDEELSADADVGEVLGDEAAEDAEDDLADFDDEFEEDFDDLDDDGAEGTSFEDLKEEYESGESDWDDADDLATEDGETAAEEGDLETDEDDLEADEGNQEAESSTAAADAVEAADAIADEALLEADDAGRAGAEASAAEGRDSTQSAAADAAGKPYLETLPDGYAGDLLVVEWLEYLVEEAGVREAAGAIDYYESIDWIDPAVADALAEYLAGFDGDGAGTLTIDHHARSLRYISRLNGGGADTVAMERLAHGGGSDGIQR